MLGTPDRAGLAVVARPVTTTDWETLADLFASQGEQGCWCQYWRQSAGDYSRGGRGENARRLHRQLDDPIAPGIVALADGLAVGWLGLWPRSRLERLVRSRTIPTIDDVDVWAIVCFMVRVGYRRNGVARALLDAAIAYAREEGAPGLEAYPVDPEGARVDVSFAYVGFTPMFERAGFRRSLETTARSAGRPRWLMRLDLR